MRADGAATTALGFCFDDAGNDTYGGTIMGLGFAWDMSVGVLCDFAGNDRYEAARQNTQGMRRTGGARHPVRLRRKRRVLGARARLCLAQHFLSLLSPPAAAISAFVVDYGGKDEYGCGVENNSYNQRGSEGGFLIDRPSRKEEMEQQAASPPPAKKNDG